MIDSEPNATSDNPPPTINARRAIGTSLMALFFVAAAFVASNWFFYRQGQRDAAVGNTEAVTAGANDSTTMHASSDDAARPAEPGDMPVPAEATDAGAANTGAIAQNDSATMPATSDGNVQPAAPSHMPKAPAAKARPIAKKHSLASLAKASHTVVVKPENRDVVLLGHPKPTYPSQALRERREGTVLVLAQVDVQGRVSDARVIGRSGSFTLDRAATSEVRRWQFQPALHDGKPVVASVQVPVSYRLEQ
jgi:protein TonB